MVDKLSESPVRIIGSRELHQNLPGILRELEHDDVRYVLTVHGKPRAVLVGAEPYLNMVLDGQRTRLLRRHELGGVSPRHGHAQAGDARARC